MGKEEEKKKEIPGWYKDGVNFPPLRSTYLPTYLPRLDVNFRTILSMSREERSEPGF